ncbi:metalloendopeptidase, partial [Coemansia sp. RSA 2559]
MATVDSFPAIPTYVGNGDGVPNFKLTPQQIESISSEYINGSMIVHNMVAAQPTPTFDNCISPIATYDNSTREAVGVVSFLKYVSADKAVRAASTAATDAINKHGAEMYMRKDVYNSICAVYQDTKETSHLQEEDKCLVEYMMETFHSYGNGLDQDKAKRFSQIYNRLDQLMSQHNQNAIETNSHVLFTREELDGLPENYFDGRLTQTIDDVDKFVVTTKNTDYGPVMRFARNPDTRKRMLVAFNSRCHMNIPILQEAVDLRREMAQLLGYRTHAERVLNDQMAETPEA